MSKLEKCSEFLETYSGRDKVMRLLCYSAQLLSGLNNSKRLDKFSDHLSECRTVLRLFDDLPMLNYTLMYGLGKKVRICKRFHFFVYNKLFSFIPCVFR